MFDRNYTFACAYMFERETMNNELIHAVQSRYGAIAASDLSGENENVQAVAKAFGYSAEQLHSIPAEANMGLSCGNPTAIASLRPGETVVDLGCGGGLDVFLASQQVGPSGRTIGIDMTPAMIDRAIENADRGGYTNVEFHLATIDRLPLADASVDCVISNCVINLAPDKPAVFREIARVLKPGGRLAVSDIALKLELPPALAQNLSAYVGCIAGAIPIDNYRRGLLEAGFAHVEIVDSEADLNVYAKIDDRAVCCASEASTSQEATVDILLVQSGSCCGESHCDPPLSLSELLAEHNVNESAASVKVYAVKPSTAQATGVSAMQK